MSRLQWVLRGCFFIAALFLYGMTAESLAENRLSSGGMTPVAGSASDAFSSEEGISPSTSKGEVPGESEKWKRGREVVVSWGDEPTRVKIIGNSVLVPVTLAYDGNEIDVYLLLDTGSTGTAIHNDIAEQLSINLERTAKTKVQVVGGGFINARVARINRLTVGPHTKRNWTVFVVPHKRSAARYDGLLGMDVLRGLKYKIDFKKQVIIWQ